MDLFALLLGNLALLMINFKFSKIKYIFIKGMIFDDSTVQPFHVAIWSIAAENHLNFANTDITIILSIPYIKSKLS